MVEHHRLTFGQRIEQDDTAPEPESNAGTRRQSRDDLLRKPPPTTCCLCGAPFQGRRYLCAMCGQKGAYEATQALTRERNARIMNAQPVHGGGRWLDH